MKQRKELQSLNSEAQTAGIVILSGTTATKVGIGIRKLEATYNNDAINKIPILALDAVGIDTRFQVPMVNADLEKMTLAANERLSLTVPDQESLKKAESQGRLWCMDSDWCKRPGVAKDNLGTGGNPRNGRGMMALNYNSVRNKIRGLLRNCQDYQLQRGQIDNSRSRKGQSDTITIVVGVSFVGGFGTGTVGNLLRILREQAHDLKLSIKVVVIGLVMGSLEPADRQTAARNQSMLLSELNAISVGDYRDLDWSPEMYNSVCDSLILISNSNNHGEFENLDSLITLTSQYAYLLLRDPMGQAIQEKAVDIEESWPTDDLGGQRWVSTMGISRIHLDTNRIIQYTANMLLGQFYNHLLKPIDNPSAIKEAQILTSEQTLTETPTKSLACERLLRPTTYKSIDVREHAIAQFNQRCGKSGGFQHCLDLENASSYILDMELPKRLIPPVQGEAEPFTANVKRAIENKVKGFLAQPDGIDAARQFCDALQSQLAETVRVNRNKLQIAQTRKRAIDENLGHAKRQLHQLKGRFWFFRMLSFGLKGRVARLYTVNTESAIRNRLEIVARLTLANEVYPAIQEVITHQIANINNIHGTVLATRCEIDAESERLKSMMPILMVPLGKELADEAFISSQFKAIVDAQGGYPSIVEKLFGEFSGRYKNLLAFQYEDHRQIGEELFKYCHSMSHRHLCDLKVAQVFKESCDGEEQLKERIAQSIRESRGRLRITGEGDEVIPTMKFIGAYDRATAESIANIANIANDIDATSGEWQMVKTNDPNSIVFFQQRCRISLSRMVMEMDQLWTLPNDPIERVKLGTDPIMAMMPAAHSSKQQLHQLIAMGLASEIIQIGTRNAIRLDRSGELVLLGSNIDAALEELRNNYSVAVHVYRVFVDQLARNPRRLQTRIRRYLRRKGQFDPSISQVLGKESFQEILDITRALLPYLSRLNLNDDHSSYNPTGRKV